MTPYLLRDYDNDRRRWFVGRTNRKRFAIFHAEWLRVARDVMRADRYLTSRMEVCRCVAHRAPINPQTGKPYNPDRIYRAIGEQLKNIQK
jgi:hypothetical protein